MRRSTFALLATVSAVCFGLFTASVAGAQAPAATISVTGTATTWSPPSVTITTGETVRWTFNGSTLSHNVHATSPNWTLQTTPGTGQGPVDHEFTEPGTYTFICDIHGPSMGGTVTVEDEPPADPLEEVLVFSKTAGFRHDSIPAGIQAIQQLGTANDFDVTATEDGAAFSDANLAQYDAVVFLSTTGDVLTDAQQDAFERYIQSGGGYVGIHAAADTEYAWSWYGDLVGGYFRNHPAGTPQASVDIVDANEPSTEGLPARWTRNDEWYNYQAPVNPFVNGNNALAPDYSPRDSEVHVLATVDESTYAESDGVGPNASTFVEDGDDDDHPISWCSQFDGGRMWYTGMGHTAESYADANFRQHILGGLETVTGAEASDCGSREAAPEPEDFEKVTLDDDTLSPMELDIAPDGRVFYIERTGQVWVYKPSTGGVVSAGNIPVTTVQENGLMGIQLAPDFATSGWVYLAYSEINSPTRSNTQVVARYKVVGDQLDMNSRQEIFTWTHQRAECCHSSGSLYFGPDGSLYISTGDNTNPFASSGFAPIDEQAGRQAWDAQRTSANTNDYNGKILRIMPMAVPTGGAPGVGTTYTIPPGNLFAASAQTKPEIYGMGFRNPFRFTVDQKTGWVLMADYGPDSGETNNPRGPQGSVEFNVVPTAGNYGWPYCIRQNVPYADYNFATGVIGPNFNCANPVNNSPNNTGLTNLPPARPATMWEAYTQTDARFPDLGTGGAPMSGPRYYYDAANPAPTKFPAYYDDQWFIAEWNVNWIKTATLDEDGNATDVMPFARGTGYLRPMDMDFGSDGSLYVIEWGSDFNGGADSGVYRLDYVKQGRRPIAHAAVTPDNGPAPLSVQFSSSGSIDPDGTALTYEWDFDGDGDVDSTNPNPAHTYTQAGTYQALLRVTDQSGQSGTDTAQVVVGNTRPVVTLEIPENGQFASFGETVPYKISVTDAEDGSTAAGTISCADVTIHVLLGHDTHAHELSAKNGCEGTVQTATDSGHGADANVFPILDATYTDEGGPNGAVAFTERDTAVLNPKRKQAEYFTSTGRAPGVTGGGDPGVQTEATTDPQGGFQNIGFIENGDYVSYNPMNFKDITGLRFRVASGGAGGTIQVRLDAPDGQLVAETAMIAPTGGWQNWTNVDLALPNPPAGTHQVFFVFRHPTDQGGLMNLNWIEARGKGAANTAAPEVTAAASPTSGQAPLEVHFDGEATDPEGKALTYQWDFGVPGTNDDTSTAIDPTYTYQRAGTYNATFTATDADGGKSSATVQVQVTAPPNQCPTNNARSDEFDGTALDLDRWSIIRPDNTRPPTVSGGNLNFPIDTGSIYEAGTTARNIVVQPLPDGQVSVTAKITTDPLTENYHQAGLRVYSNDNNWASVHMIYAGTGRDFEFIYENNGVARNGAADKLGGIPADSPNTYWVRLISDGSTLRAQYSFNGTVFSDVGQPANISAWTDKRVGPTALSGDTATTYPVAHFDWIHFDPDVVAPGGGGNTQTDEFNGTALASPPWSVVRQDQTMSVGSGTLNLPAQPGDIYGGRNDAKNLVLRDAPSGEWTATTKVNFEGTAQYHQAGLIVYGDDGNFTKFGRIAHTAAGDEKFEFIYENAGTPRNDAADSTANIATDFPDDFYLRITSDGTNVTGAYSTDGNAWTPVGRPAPLPANAKIGMFAFSNDGVGNPVAAFDSFSLVTGDGGGGPAGPSRDDQFSGAALDKTRWNAIVRENATAYNVSGGNLNITTETGDIYSGDTVPPPNNFILQSADHAGADWVIETKIDSKVDGGYGQGGLIAYLNGDNYVKLDPIADAGQTRINRVELRTEVNGTPTGPTGTPDPPIDAGTGTVFYLRLTKTGTSYKGEVSRDGTTWVNAGTVENPMASPSFGVFAFGPQAAGQGDLVSFDYFLLDGEDPDQCECEGGAGNGDEFDGASIDTTKFNRIIRDDPGSYTLAGGQLRATTDNGDIYQTPNAATAGPFFLQTADHAGTDWVIETKLDADQLSGGYEQGGLLAYKDDDNYVKFDVLSDDGTTAINRIELRSEVAGVIVNPQPQLTPLPANTGDVWLRLTKTGNDYAGAYSFDGTTFTTLAQTVANAMTTPDFGLFTLGVNSGGGTVAFDYFDVDGNRGECEEPEPENQNPQIQTATASPTIGFAPLPVQFNATATDPDAGDTVTYSWDFDNNGTEDSTQQNPTFTYTTPGEKTAKLTVSDGKGGTATRNVTVNVLEADNASARFRVLVFSKTEGFRHGSIGPGHTAIEQLGTANNFQVDHTEDATAFRDDILEHYDSVIWLSTTGDVLNATQQAAFERYIEAGGGYTGIHSAADTEYDWKWYGNLVGAYFLSHPPGTPDAVVHVEDTDDHSTQGLPAPNWPRTDEWYNYKPVNFEETGNVDYSPRANVHVLITLDESTYGEEDGNTTDDDHPISWCHRYDGGRSWYTGMGHTDASFSEADYLEHILGGIEVSAGAAPSEECGATEPGQPVVQGFADPATGDAPLEVQFSSTAADPDGDPLIYRWTFGDGGSALGSNPVHTYTKAGSYTATVTVRDPDGNVGTDTVQITVNAPGNQIPMVVTAADPTEGNAPLPVRFQAQAIDPDGPENQLVYRWSFGDGDELFGRNVRHTYLTPGTYKAKVTVTDAKGGSVTSEEITITVANPPGNAAPTVQALAAPKTGTAPLRVDFTSASSDPDGDQLLSVWDFGDGVKAGGESATHTYTQPGTYNAKITVTDPGGKSATATVQIVVKPKTTSGGGTVQPPPNRGGVQGEEESSPRVALGKRFSVQRVLRHGLRYTVSCETECRVSSVLKLKGERLGKSNVRRIAGGHSRKIVVRLSGNVRRNLVAAMRQADVRSVRATLVLKVRTADGTKTIRRAVTLRR